MANTRVRFSGHQARANFEGADLSDVLMDRAVIVEANLKNAILQRAVLTRSDLGQADIYGVRGAACLLRPLLFGLDLRVNWPRHRWAA